MTVIAINGTPLQPAINAMASGDTLDVKAGGYAGRLIVPKGKTVTLRSDGGAILDGGQGDGFINLLVDSAVIDLQGFDLRHSGCAVRTLGDCTGSRFLYNQIPIVDFIVNTSSTGWGGNAFACSSGSKGIEIAYNAIRKARAPSAAYGTDGGAFELFEARDIWFHHNEVWDCVNLAESGKNAGGPDNTGIVIEDNIFHGRPNWATVPAAQAIIANGMYLRALTNSKIRRNTFDRLDWWDVLFSAGGSYGGSFAGVEVTDNIFILNPGVSRMVTTNAGVVLGSFTYDRNKVYADPTTRVAEINGKRYTKTDLAQFRIDTGWEKAGSWNVTAAPSIVSIVPTPGVVTVSEDSALTAMRAERDAALAQVASVTASLATLQASLAAVTAARDTARILASGRNEALVSIAVIANATP